MKNNRTIAKKWWRSNRLRYNKGLLMAGFISIMLYAILGELIIAPHEEFELAIFEMIFPCSAYFLMICLANIFYGLGSIVDTMVNDNNSQPFREMLFSIGYWFSFASPILFVLGIMGWFLVQPHTSTTVIQP